MNKKKWANHFKVSAKYIVSSGDNWAILDRIWNGPYRYGLYEQRGDEIDLTENFKSARLAKLYHFSPVIQSKYQEIERHYDSYSVESRLRVLGLSPKAAGALSSSIMEDLVFKDSEVLELVGILENSNQYKAFDK